MIREWGEAAFFRLFLQHVERAEPSVQAVPTVTALRDGITERIDNEVFEFVIPYCYGWNRLELVAEVFVVGESAVNYDNNMVVLDEYRIVVAISVQDLLTGPILHAVISHGIDCTYGISLVDFGAKQI